MSTPALAHQGLAALFGLATAVANALAVTTQYVASQRSAARATGWRVALDLARQPLWLLGWLALVGSLVAQALALHFGPMAEVQPLLISELVVALVLRRWWLGQSVRTLTWVAGALSTVALGLFLLDATPGGGVARTAPGAWRVVVVGAALGVGVLVVAGRRGATPRRRAASWGSATAIAWALEATFIKATTDVIANDGFRGILGHWPVYAFVFGGVTGLFCEQMALHVGPLSVSQPCIVVVDPVVSVALGAVLFDERWRQSGLTLALGALGFVIACAAAVVMIETSPSGHAGVVDHL